MIININVTNKRPVVNGAPTIVCGNSTYLIEFAFDGEWSAYPLKTARFVYYVFGAVKYKDVVFSGDTVAVPVLSNIDVVYVGVYAGDLCTTTPAQIKCERSILCGVDTKHDDITPDIYNQILTACNAFLSTEIAKLCQATPEFADNVTQCTDKSKLYVLPDGYIYAYFEDGGPRPQFTNQLPVAKGPNGGVYNGVGYKEGVYWSTDKGGELALTGAYLTGLIRVEDGDWVRLQNVGLNLYNDHPAEANSLVFFPDSGGYYTEPFTMTVEDLFSEMMGDEDWLDEDDNLVMFNPPTSGYLRLNTHYLGADSIITVNQEIVYDEHAGAGWQSTGHAFVPADYEDRIAALERAVVGDMHIYGVVDSENNIIMTGSLTPGTYTLNYLNEDGGATCIGSFTME